ncbi:MAG: MoxR family ATPase [Candidatus Omnitrophota bacterium]|nr:MAG: MoxR family ATPase [Candidatus Omnitrophota bacterium]
MSIEERTEHFREDFIRLRNEIGKVIVGQQDIIDGAMTCLFAGGNALLEGVPGLGKTLLVRTMALALDLQFSRIQFTPDLMPADIIGTNVIDQSEDGSRRFRFESGPIFANMVLADEVNRATPKTQSALLEAMQEHRVTVGGTTYTLDQPFVVLATQNPLEMEGTYPLPEAQLDRFMLKLIVEYPSREELTEVLVRTTDREDPTPQVVMQKENVKEMRVLCREVPIASHVRDYAVRCVLATHPGSEFATDMTNQFVRYGSSPRGAQALILAGKIKALLDGRFNVSFDDIRSSVKSALRHRLILNFEGEAEGMTADRILDSVLEQVGHTAKAV